MIPRIILAWIPMVFIGIANGMMREFGYKPYVDELLAHQISTVTAIILFGIYTWLIKSWLRLASSRQAWLVGGIWLSLTVAFEFLFGHYLMKHSWSHLLHDYNIFEGRVWLLVLIAILVLPYIVYKIRRRLQN